MSTEEITPRETKIVYVNPDQAKMVKWVHSAASKDKTRFSLLPVYVVADQQQTEFFASDGFRIHWATLPADPASAWETGMYLMAFSSGMVLLETPTETESVLHLVREIITTAQNSRGLETHGAERVAVLVDLQTRYVQAAMACPATASRTWLRGGAVEIEFFNQETTDRLGSLGLVARAFIMPYFLNDRFNGHKLANGHGCIPVVPQKPAQETEEKL